jgi:hypothetical protein
MTQGPFEQDSYTPNSCTSYWRDLRERGCHNRWSHTVDRGSGHQLYVWRVLRGTVPGRLGFLLSVDRHYDVERQASSHDVSADVSSGVSPVSAAVPTTRTAHAPAAACWTVLPQLRGTSPSQREILWALRFSGTVGSCRHLSTTSTIYPDNINNELDNPLIDTLIYIFCVIYGS